MKKILAWLLALPASRDVHDDTLRANQFDDRRRFSPYLWII
jgi:hypothetical protein